MNELKRYNFLVSEINGVFHDAAVMMGLSDSAMTVLYAICNSGDACPLQQIVRMTGTSKQTINSALRKLEAEGILYLETAGGRKKTVCLTEAGKELTRNTAGKLIQTENNIFASWPEEDRRKYLELTQRYLDQLREKIKELQK